MVVGAVVVVIVVVVVVVVVMGGGSVPPRVMTNFACSRGLENATKNFPSPIGSWSVFKAK